jgi:hypothetical protein
MAISLIVYFVVQEPAVATVISVRGVKPQDQKKVFSTIRAPKIGKTKQGRWMSCAGQLTVYTYNLSACKNLELC